VRSAEHGGGIKTKGEYQQMTNERIKEIIAEEASRLPGNVDFKVTFHGNGAYIYAREFERHKERVECWVDGVYSPYITEGASAYFLDSQWVYGIQGEKKVRELIGKLVDFALENASPEIVHFIPTEKAVREVEEKRR